MAKVALLIGVSEYQSGLAPLPAAEKDVAAFQRVLQDPELGAFDEVKPLLNLEPQVMQYEIETFFTGRAKDDLVLLYFSGHGIKDDRGNLYFATPITHNNDSGNLVRSSTVSAQFVHDILGSSRAKRQVIILDCCFSGAFDSSRLKDDGGVDLPGQLGAEGRVVLASSSAVQPSLAQSETELSLYTRYLIEGIETGAGDLNEDGKITVQELHHYAFDRVQATAPSMTPKLISLKDLGFEIILSKARITDPQLRYRKTMTRFATGDKIRPAGRAVLDTLRQQLGLTQAETDAIEAEVFRPYRERLANLQKYREALLAEAAHEYPLSREAQDAMAMLQGLLGLREEDVTPIRQKVETQFNQQTFLTAPEPLQPIKQSVISDSSPNNTQTSQMTEEFLKKHFANLSGLKKYDARDYQGAIEDYNRAIQLNPNDADTYYNRGLARSALGDQQGAIEDYNQAIRLKPDYAFAYTNRGNAKSALGDQQGAIEDYNQAIRLNPDRASAYTNRGLAKSALGDKQGAVEDYNRAIQLNPNDADTYYNRGIAKSALSDQQGAIEDYNQAIQLKPNDASAYTNRGAFKSALGDKQGAVEDYNQAIQLNPNDTHAYNNRGNAKYALGDKQGAIKDYNEAIQLESDYANAYYTRGLAKSDLGDQQGALTDFRTAAKLYQRQGNTGLYRNALNRIQELEK